MSKTHVLAWLDAVALADIDTAAKAVALVMATHANYATGEDMRAGTARIAQLAGLAERRTREMVGVLRDAGLIEWDGVRTAPGRARRYRLTIPDGGSRLPVSHRQRGATVTEPTPAITRSNTGNNSQQHRQRAAAQQSPNRARTARAAAGAPEARPAALAPGMDSHVFAEGCCQLPEANRVHIAVPVEARALAALLDDNLVPVELVDCSDDGDGSEWVIDGTRGDWGVYGVLKRRDLVRDKYVLDVWTGLPFADGERLRQVVPASVAKYRVMGCRTDDDRHLLALRLLDCPMASVAAVLDGLRSLVEAAA